MPIKHEWNGTILTITSDSGTSSADLQGAKGATGARGARGLTGRTGGGALIEDGVIRDDTTWSSAGIMDRFAEAFGTSGNPVVCNNALANVPFNIITEFDVKQEGSGNPYPAGGSKNKLQLYKPNQTTTAGITRTINADGTITVNGTASGTGNYLYLQISPTFPLDAGTYTLSGCPTGGSNDTYRLSIFNNVNGTNSDEKREFGDGREVIVETASNYIIMIVIKNGTTVNNLTYYPMIRLSTEDATFAPYENIRPIVSYDTISITRSGKNICSGVVMGAAYITKNGTFNTSQPNYTSTNKFVVAEGVNYIDSTDNNTSLNRKTFHYWNDKGEWLGVWKGTEGYTLNNRPVGAVMAAITYYNPDTTQIAKWAQVELGETATDYEPYKADSYSISLGDTYYGGTLDWNTGELVVDKKGINANELNWYYAETNKFFYTNTKVSDSIICSHYTYDGAKTDAEATAKDCVITVFKNYEGMRIKDLRYTSVEAFNAYLQEQYNAGTPITVVYELAEPEVIQLEPQIIKALSGTNTLTTNADNIDLVGRYDTAKTIKELLERVAALEAKVGE